MAHPDRRGHARNPNVLSLRNIIIFGALTVGLLGLAGCTPSNASSPIQEPIPTTALLPTQAQQPTDEMHLIVVTPDMGDPTNTPIIITPTAQIPHSIPTEWGIGIDGITESTKRVEAIVAQQPDQKSLAEAILPNEYLQAVVRFGYHHYNANGENKLFGGTGTVVAQDDLYSYILTATHVALPSNPIDLTISSPFSGTDQAVTLTDMAVFQSDEEGRGDIAIARVPRIPTVSPFSNFNTTYCGVYQPSSADAVTFVGFPFVNHEYIPVLSTGTVENITTPCWYEDSSQSLYLSTTNVAIPGFSGGLMLNGQNQGIAVESAVGPNGAQGVPLGETTVPSLLAKAGYVAP